MLKSIPERERSVSGTKSWLDVKKQRVPRRHSVRRTPFHSKTALTLSKNSRLAYAGGCALIVLLAIIVYYPALNGGFVFDDGILLHDSKAILASDGLYQIWCTSELLDYWPITNTSYRLDRVAALGKEYDGLPPDEPHSSRRRLHPALDRIKKIIRPRLLFRRLALCRSSGER